MHAESFAVLDFSPLKFPAPSIPHSHLTNNYMSLEKASQRKTSQDPHKLPNSQYKNKYLHSMSFKSHLPPVTTFLGKLSRHTLTTDFFPPLLDGHFLHEIRFLSQENCLICVAKSSGDEGDEGGVGLPYSIPRTTGFKFSPQQNVNLSLTYPWGACPESKPGNPRPRVSSIVKSLWAIPPPSPGSTLFRAMSTHSHFDPELSNISRLMSYHSQYIIFNVKFSQLQNQNRRGRLRKVPQK